MAVDSQQVKVGTLDITALARYLTLDVSPYSAGTFQYVARNGASIGSWSCSIKRAIGPGAPQAFPTALAFTSSVLSQPNTNAADLSGTDIVVFTNDVVGSSGAVDIYAMLKA